MYVCLLQTLLTGPLSTRIPSTGTPGTVLTGSDCAQFRVKHGVFQEPNQKSNPRTRGAEMALLCLKTCPCNRTIFPSAFRAPQNTREQWLPVKYLTSQSEIFSNICFNLFWQLIYIYPSRFILQSIKNSTLCLCVCCTQSIR